MTSSTLDGVIRELVRHHRRLDSSQGLVQGSLREFKGKEDQELDKPRRSTPESPKEKGHRKGALQRSRTKERKKICPVRERRA